ncbi:MAG TPA: hypothetical protein VF079_06445 [Sphingomicrobium sp.]
MTLLHRLFPKQFDDRFGGLRAALWLLGLILFLKFAMSLNSIFNTEQVAAGADKFPLASYGADGARAVLMLFALHSLAELMLALVGLAALVRYRAMVPLVFLLLAIEHVGRRLIVQAYAIERSAPTGTPTSAAFIVNMGLLALLLAGLALSLIPSPERKISK